MRRYPFVTVDVFTEQRFGGNQLAVFPDAEGLSDTEMQALAAEFNLSETVFVLPPRDPANTARVRIFNRTYEMPFAGHPNLGTGYVLARRGLDKDGLLRFEETAGLVEVRVEREGGEVTGASIEAPQPLQRIAELASADVAACLGLEPAALVTGAHAPTFASVGIEFVLAEVAPEALAQAAPDITAFRRVAAAHPALGKRLSILFYARGAGETLRARMFAPLSGTWEDAATGSANAALGALLLSLGDAPKARFDVLQGVEMGRPSRLQVTAWRVDGEIRAGVGGRCVPVLSGEAEV